VVSLLQNGPSEIELVTPHGNRVVPSASIPVPDYEVTADYLHWLDEQSKLRMGVEMPGVKHDPDYDDALSSIGLL
jgi:hypothetical protein